MLCDSYKNKSGKFYTKMIPNVNKRTTMNLKKEKIKSKYKTYSQYRILFITYVCVYH